MTYMFPESLRPLRAYLEERGYDIHAFATARQVAFMAQQLIGSRIKFPPKGSDMTSTLWLIQEAVVKSKEIPANKVKSSASRVVTNSFQNGSGSKNTGKSGLLPLAGKGKKPKPQPAYLTAFDPAGVSVGYHVFCDGACVPNPGPGGWGFAVYKDGQEIASDCGGDLEATNNTMELTGLLRAIEWACQYPAITLTIWCDSQYAVKGANDWRHGWKAKGWQRGSDKAEMKNRHLANVDLWIAIDEALASPRAASISIAWVKSHAGFAGNERADELAEIGRTSLDDRGLLLDQLDAEYRAVMAG